MKESLLLAATLSLALAPSADLRSQSVWESANGAIDAAKSIAEFRQAAALVETSKQKLLQQAIEDARQQRPALQQQIRRLEKQNAAREWALAHLGVQTDRRSPGEMDEVQDKAVARWRRISEKKRLRYTAFPDEIKGKIRSGRALNFLLDTCGAAATDLQLYENSAIEERKADELRLVSFLKSMSDSAQTPDDLRDALRGATLESSEFLATQVQGDDRVDPAIVHQVRELQATVSGAREKMELLSSLGGKATLTPKLLRSLKFTRGDGSDQQIVVTLSGDVLPLNWPMLIRTDERYAAARSTLEKLKHDALAEIATHGKLEHHTLKALLDASDNIYKTFEADKIKLLGYDRGAQYKKQVFRAMHFTKSLRSGVAYLVTARDAEAVESYDFAEPCSPAELLAMVAKEGLRFAPSGYDHQTNYVLAYKKILPFYADLYGIAEVIETDSDRLDELRDEEDALRNLLSSGVSGSPELGAKNQSRLARFVNKILGAIGG